MLHTYSVGVVIGLLFASRRIARYQLSAAVSAPGSAKSGPITTPTLYVWSTGDAYIGETAARDVERHVDGPYRFEVLSGVSHWITEEAPERFSALLLDHLAAW